jgi:nucleoid-associated protein YgaU
MTVNVKNSSRLLFSDLVVVDDVEFWDVLVLPDATPKQDDIQHIVSSGDRIDLIAQRYYQDPGLWWVIAWANGLDILPTDLKENAQIRIPSAAFVSNELRRARRRG